MDILDGMSKRMPAMVFLSLIFSALYNAGFLSASSNIDLLSSISYQDYITSSLYFFPVVFVVVVFLRLIYLNVINIEFYGKKIRLIFPIISGILGSLIYILDLYNIYFLSYLAIVSCLSPFLYMVITRIYEGVNRSHIGLVMVMVALSGMSYIDGYTSYRENQCRNLRIISTNFCKDCILLRLYSDVILMKKEINGSLIVEKNNNNYEIRIDDEEVKMVMQTSYCLPSRKWLI